MAKNYIKNKLDKAANVALAGLFGLVMGYEGIHYVLKYFYPKEVPIVEEIEQKAPKFKLEEKLKVSEFDNLVDNYINALIQIESNGNPNASRYEKHLNDTSYGLTQILTSTAKELEKNHQELPRLDKDIKKTLCNPDSNKAYARAFLEDLHTLYGNNPKLIAAAYNSGPKRPLFARVQQQLNKLYNFELNCDGVIGKDTKKIIKKVQLLNNLKEDGILGPKTYKKIQELWIEKFPNTENPKGIVPNVPRVIDYAERFNNLILEN